jgi:serine protease Do
MKRKIIAGVALFALSVFVYGAARESAPVPGVFCVYGSTAQSSDDTIPEILKNVSPSVVAIIGNYKPDGLPTYMEKYNDRTAHGSGVVIKQSGEILTNAHVVKNLENITVVFADGSRLSAKIKCSDDLTDLAVIKVDKNDLLAIKIGDMADVTPGKTVIAIGTPISFSLRNSASAGIISGLNRGVDSTYQLIQTDAAINPGNSGGPLINLKGELIGINSMKFAGVGVEGMGFSIPVGTVKYVLSNFDAYSKVLRPVTGMTFEESWEAKHGLPTQSGLKVKKLEEKQPAAAAGVEEGDVITEVNGDAVHSVVDFNELMKNVGIGGQIKLKIQRGGQTIDATVNPNF